MESELIKQMILRGTSPFDLTEFDQWVNDATRKDIESLLKENNNVFGLKMWTWEKIPAERLDGICNFGVNLIFKKEDEEKVDILIEEYKQGKKKEIDIVDDLFKLAVYDCLWV